MKYVFAPIGRKIASVRVLKDLTQEELAERSQMRRVSIAQIETGKCAPTVSSLEKIADGLGMRLKIDFEEIANQEPVKIGQNSKRYSRKFRVASRNIKHSENI